jgi:hypothetical protein
MSKEAGEGSIRRRTHPATEKCQDVLLGVNGRIEGPRWCHLVLRTVGLEYSWKILKGLQYKLRSCLSATWKEWTLLKNRPGLECHESPWFYFSCDAPVRIQTCLSGTGLS